MTKIFILVMLWIALDLFNYFKYKFCNQKHKCKNWLCKYAHSCPKNCIFCESDR